MTKSSRDDFERLTIRCVVIISLASGCLRAHKTPQTQARVKPYICTMPLRLSEGWNQVQLNIADLMRKAYGTTFVEVSRGMYEMIARREIEIISLLRQYKYMQTVGYDESILLRKHTRKKSCHPSSSFTFRASLNGTISLRLNP